MTAETIPDILRRTAGRSEALILWRRAHLPQFSSIPHSFDFMLHGTLSLIKFNFFRFPAINSRQSISFSNPSHPSLNELLNINRKNIAKILLLS